MDDHAPPPPPLPADASPGDGSTDEHAQAPGTQAPEPIYTALEDWLAGYFLPMFRPTLGGEDRWCHQWWQHGEAISRLTSLWHAWEVLRLQPGTGIATWYRDHLDHQLPILMGARGPFYQCSENADRRPRTGHGRRPPRALGRVGHRRRRPHRRAAACPAIHSLDHRSQR